MDPITELGFYHTRSGEVLEVFKISNEHTYPVYAYRDKYLMTFTREGRYEPGHPHEWDIVSFLGPTRDSFKEPNGC